MNPYTAFMNNAATLMGGQPSPQALAAMAAAQQYAAPQVPTYQGPVSSVAQPSLQSPQIPQPGAGMTATNGVLSQVPGLLKYLQGMKGQNGASGSLDNIFNYAQTSGQGNPAMYGSVGNWLNSIFGGGANPYAGMGAPT